MACDIASFGDLARTDHVQRHIRAALYGRLQGSFDQSGVPLARCYTEDRGDGVIVVVPPDISTATLVSPLVDLLRAELRKHNEVSSEVARIRLRVALHTGEVRTDEHGIVGTAVNHVFRILEAPEFKSALNASDSCLAFIASESVYDAVIRHAFGLIDPAEYRPITVRVKETKTRGWVRVPGDHPVAREDTREITPSGRDVAAFRAPPPVAEEVGYAPPGGALFQIVDGLLDLPIMATANGREEVVGALRKEIATVIPRQSEARMDTYCILRTCLDYPDGLAELVAVVRAFVGDSAAMRALEDTITRLIEQR
jgi:hypothetical protein